MNRRSILKATAMTAIAGVSAPFGAVFAQEADIDTSTIVEMAIGPEDAKVTVVEYASFTCPHCANFHTTTFKDLKTNYIDTGKIRFIYRDVYFDRFGLWGAMVARCGGSERFFGISDMLYEQQRDWLGNRNPGDVAANLRKIGKIAGIPEDTLEGCLNDENWAKTLVAWYQENAESDGVNSTPTLFVNGEKYGNMSYGDLKEVIDGELAG